MTTETPIRLSELFEKAVVYGARAHDGDVRKKTTTPYFSHPLQVAGIALEHGADEEQAAAALLHDVIEDTAVTHAELAHEFGARVADIVRACSDTEDHEEKGDWRRRKVDYLAHLKSAGPDVALVSCADKLHNARSIVMDLRAQGPGFLDKTFTGKRKGTLWYYGELVEVFAGLDVPAVLREELRIAVEAMQELS